MVYKWNNFGFTGIREFQVKNDCDGILCYTSDVYLLQKGDIAGVIPVKSLTDKYSSDGEKGGSQRDHRVSISNKNRLDLHK